MKYISTRGHVEPKGFIDTVLMGLADDGGLMVPSEIPAVSAATLEEWRSLSYQELFLKIFALYAGDEIPYEDLKELVATSYASFRSPEVTPLHQVNDSLYVLELFHGPTFAFKDVALQFMGELYSYISRKRGEIIHILGATSGDTGAAAIQGVRGKEGIKICILHPHGKVSKVQELQMTTVDDSNVLNLSVHGNFDDCQKVIKDLFADLEFKSRYHLRAINSINFVRILAQTVYYFYAYLHVEGSAEKKINISVPSGNFGNIFSGYLAQQMGLPINKLIIATNENNILERFVNTGEYKPGNFTSTYSPSMDIQVASNFERYLYYLLGEDAEKLSSYMSKLQSEGKITVDGKLLEQVQSDFAALGAKNQQCLDTIGKYKQEYDYLLDPHTACGIAAYEAFNGEGETAISFATAHPAKFDEAIQLIDIKQEFPAQIAALFEMPQHQTVVEHDPEAIVRELKAFYE
jgi:threonine synthase